MNVLKKIILFLIPVIVLSGGCDIPRNLLYTPGIIQYTTYGQVQGTKEEYPDPSNPEISYSVLSWQGIPYAKQPVGELKHKPPQNPQAWKRIRKLVPLEADNLCVNIFRPDTREYNLPVNVFIPSSSTLFNNPQGLRDFLKQTNSIAVFIQYRRDIPSQDQVMALKWIKNNIVFFGGAPENITLSTRSAEPSHLAYLQNVSIEEPLFHKITE